MRQKWLQRLIQFLINRNKSAKIFDAYLNIMFVLQKREIRLNLFI